MTLEDSITTMDDERWAALTKRVAERAIVNAQRLGQAVPADLVEIAAMSEPDLASHRFARRLRQLPPAQRRTELIATVRAIVAKEIGLPSNDVDPDRPFVELGLDSLTFLSTQARVTRTIGIQTSSAAYWSYPTVTQLVDNYLLPLITTGRTRPADAPSTPEQSPEPPSIAPSIEPSVSQFPQGKGRSDI